MLSLGCSGFLAPLFSRCGGRKWLATAVAGLVSSIPVVVALAALLLSQPGSVMTGSALAGRTVDCLQGFCVGFNLLVALRLLLPAVKQSGASAARTATARWALGGAVGGTMLQFGTAALCLGTPYCLVV